jgi:asparagine synthase (glutamine-hydrolysing)
MSVQFGRWNFEGQPLAPDDIEKVSVALAPYGADSNESYSKGGINILYRAFHTTKESRREKEPCISRSGAVITWDGRLDNRADLISELRDSLTANSSDVAIVAAAYEKWAANCLGKLIGDWALSIWNPREPSLLLAKDPIGTKHLYYSFDDKQLTWSTILDPLVLFAGRTFALNADYVASWLLSFPAAHLTPYVGVQAVPPACLVLLKEGKCTLSKYWDFDPSKRIRYRTDAEYEEHFLDVFATAVQRRLRSDRPVLAELSGGLDSSSIVCMADSTIARGAAETPRLDTISWYDDSYDNSQPDFNELPYITEVERKRGRTGCHINVGALRREDAFPQIADFEGDRFAATPIPNRDLSELFKRFAAYMTSQGHRVTLSGLGGETATGGGVPTPTPELQDLLATAQFSTLARQLKSWAVKMRKPRLPLLFEVVRGFVPAARNNTHPVPWLHSGLVRRKHAALCGSPSRIKLFGPLPSFQHHLHALDGERRLQAYFVLQPELLREIRYPYLDRGLLEFTCAIPREQIVRVGERRSLMRRALLGIVPNELLNRKRKRFFRREPVKSISTEWTSLVEMSQHMVSSSMGIIDPNRLLEALQKARHNQEGPIDSLRRTLTLEFWLRHVTTRGILTNSMSTRREGWSSSLEVKELQLPAQRKGSAS